MVFKRDSAKPMGCLSANQGFHRWTVKIKNNDRNRRKTLC